ncbi:hypothetical protein [Sphingobium sp. CAP-1]|uniref:hypothetical protein n=1 Tax=Sphingobium sp. CAP-1 TaxID=2676077 RepID=UPI0012BB2AFB|nr:hypothetical protein [Sphingobium sp. CAP-1]QGP78391.1 hypothetical protein GL174_04870 [Sphingobium sp. CAP-1]
MSAPFGISLFADLVDFEVIEDLGQGKFRVAAPKPHPAFNDYFVEATDGLGVVWIKANSSVLNIDAFGHALTAPTDKIADQIKLKYGKPQKNDFLMPGSIWDGAQYWLSGLEAKERFYSYIWDRKNVAGLPDDIDTIYVGAAAYGGGEGAVAVEYASTKMHLAEKERDAKLADLF